MTVAPPHKQSSRGNHDTTAEFSERATRQLNWLLQSPRKTPHEWMPTGSTYWSDTSVQQTNGETVLDCPEYPRCRIELSYVFDPHAASKRRYALKINGVPVRFNRKAVEEMLQQLANAPDVSSRFVP